MEKVVGVAARLVAAPVAVVTVISVAEDERRGEAFPGPSADPTHGVKYILEVRKSYRIRVHLLAARNFIRIAPLAERTSNNITMSP